MGSSAIKNNNEVITIEQVSPPNPEPTLSPKPELANIRVER